MHKDIDRVGEILDAFVFCYMATNRKGLKISFNKPVRDTARMIHETEVYPDLAIYDSITVVGTTCHVDSESFDDVKKIGNIDYDHTNIEYLNCKNLLRQWSLWSCSGQYETQAIRDHHGSEEGVSTNR